MQTPVFGFGDFFGRSNDQLSVPGFTFSELAQTKSQREVPKHSHVEAHFVLVLKGAYLTSASGISDICAPSALIYNPRGTTHRDCFQADSGGKFFTISVANSAFGMLPAPVLETGPTGHSQGESQWLGHRIYYHFVNRDLHTRDAVGELGLELLENVSCLRARPDAHPPCWLKHARELLHDCMREKPLIREIATAVGVHPLHLIRSFRLFYQCSPGEYLRKIRVQYAADMLSRTREPISQVTFAAGFSDQSHLTRVFKKCKGLTPAAYRNLF